MNRSILLVSLFVATIPCFSQTPVGNSQGGTRLFPESDFILHDDGLKPQKGGVVLGPMKSDGKGGTVGSFAVYGGPSLIQVGSLGFSEDGKLLAVGSTPGRVDLWDVEKRTKL